MFTTDKQFKMDTYVSQAQLQTPTNVLKNLDRQSAQSMVLSEEKDFKKFLPSAWKVVVDLPLERVTNRAIFAINISGYMPYWNLADPFYPTALKNLAPIQAFSHSLDYVHIYHEQTTLPIQTMYTSHRSYTGNVGVGLRVQGNTAQSGSFMVTQANTCVRNYYRVAENFNGLRFLNSSDEGTDYAMESFFLGDLSINRNWSITTMSQSTLPTEDLAFKLSELERLSYNPNTTGDLTTTAPFTNQFTEDWLLFTPLADLPNANGNQITFELFYDYSNVQFNTMMLPYLASCNTDSTKQILNVSASINNRAFVKSNAIWGVNALRQNTISDKVEDDDDDTQY
jgi:hypothetical protein